MNDQSDARPAVPRAVGRVLDLLEIVLDEPRNLTAAAQAADLTPTTALRHLRALETRGYVSRQLDGTFSPGPTVRRLAATLREHDDVDRLVGITQPHLDDLAAATGESAYLAIGDGRVATYIARTESDRAIRHVGWIGQTVPLDGTAVGAALRGPGRCETRTGAVDPDITAISYGLPGFDGMDVAISIIGPAQRLGTGERPRLQRALRAAAEHVMRDLGGGAVAS